MSNTNKSQWETTLSLKDVTQLSSELRNYFKLTISSEKIRIKLIFLIETILDSFRTKFSDETKVIVYVSKVLGTKHIFIETKGESFNPLQNAEEESFEEIYSHIFDKSVLLPEYKYKNSTNIIDISFSEKHSTSVLSIIIAIALSLTTYGLTRFLSASAVSFISTKLIHPLYELGLEVLEIFSLMLIFCSVITSITSVKNRSQFGKYSSTVAANIGLGNLATALIIFCTLPFFAKILNPSAAFDKSIFYDLYKIILSIVPKNIFSPFIESNALQIITLGIFSGSILFVLGKKTQTITSVFNEGVIFSTEALSKICKLSPVFVYLSLTLILLNNHLSSLLASWKLFVVFCLYTVVYAAVNLIIFFKKFHISPADFFHHTWKFFVKSFLTTSFVTSLPEMEETAVEEYKVDHNFAKFAFPSMEVFYKVQFVICSCVSFIMISNQYGVTYSVASLIVFLIFILIGCTVAPPVAGGVLIVYEMLITKAGLPEEALSILVVLDAFETMITMGVTSVMMIIMSVFMDRSIKRIKV